MDRFIKVAEENREILAPLAARARETTNLCALVWAVWALARQWGVVMVQDELRRRNEERVDWGQCPHCSARLESKGSRSRRMLTLLGWIRWRRKAGRCPNGCEVGHVVPLDESLGITPWQKTCESVQKVGCQLGVFVPFETAARFLKQLTGVSVSGDSVWSWVQARGRRARQNAEQELQAAQQGDLPAEEPRAARVSLLPLALAADALQVPLRAQPGAPDGEVDWREAKVGLVVRLDERETKKGKKVTVLRQRRVVAVRGDVAKLESRFRLEAIRQGVLAARDIVWLSDGGAWLWKLLERLREPCPAIVAVLDFYHAAQNLWKGIEKCFDGDEAAARAYFEAARHELRHGDPDNVLAGLQAALALPDLSEEARKLLANAHEYLLAHRDHIDYALFKDLGLPIGSGLIESAVKWLIQQRFKCVGMRWSESGFDNLLELRVAWANDRFDDLFASAA